MQGNNRSIIIITGPTAVGKTKYAIEAAKAFRGEIISADSMQIYKYMDIGSAKPTKKELALTTHHLIDILEPEEEFSAAAYQDLAKNCINKVFNIGKIPIISGGTGLYLNSLIYDMDFSIMPKQAEFRERLEKEARTYGAEHLHNKLLSLDKEAAERIHPNNLKKVIRAIELLELTGGGVRRFEESFVTAKDYDCVMIGLTRNRDELYQRIDMRVDQMISAGLVDEVIELQSRGLSEKNMSMQGIGYKEILPYLRGEYDLNEAVRLIKRNTRHYAKRQLTWFRRYTDMAWFNLSDFKTDEKAISSVIDKVDAVKAAVDNQE
ncbi:MAG: tRNA (adenosine(37)-N6)-dimethylallyltransferase MiaA [Eubacteriales bacterium]|nr:tRNA (adenosine(37)-N6)-dimethylallyltransferase MiaA [Eubacteriales bacterium]